MDMEHATHPYTAVFHFRDDQLLEAFLAKIPRSQLLEYVRDSESLRNRHFPGFRLSSTVPTFRQILTAYRKEIVDRGNNKLANALCADWIRQQPLLASTALQSLGIPSANPADARSWIEAVQSQLELPSYKDIVGRLVWKLAAQFPSEDILIFVSIISYGVDQQTLRKLVDYELAKSATDPAKQKERLESELQSANTKIKNLEPLAAELECLLQSELTKAREVLDRFLLEDDALATALAKDEEAIQEFTRQIEETKSSLLNSQHARDGRQKERQKVSKAITRQREELLRRQSGFEKRVKEVKDSIQQESSRIAELTKSLVQVEELILANQPREKEVASAKPSEPQQAEDKQADMVSESATPVEAMSGQSPKHTSESVGNNAVCYQGIQRTFRNAVVAFLRERLTRLFPEDHIQRMKKTFGEEWEKAAQNAALSRDNLGTRTIVRDEYDLLGTNHFYGLFERFYDKLFSPEAGQPPDLPRPVKTRLLGNLKASSSRGHR